MADVNDCSNCQSPVLSRRKSQSGEHWCSKPECQAAKQRFYRSRGRSENPDVEAERLQLLRDAANLERVACHACSCANALPGWVHRDDTGLRGCMALGRRGAVAGLLWLDAVHPERVPS